MKGLFKKKYPFTLRGPDSVVDKSRRKTRKIVADVTDVAKCRVPP